MVVKGPKRNSILLYVAKIWEESANKFKWAYKGGLRMHAKRGTLWMPFVCILPIECPLFRPFYGLCLLKLTMQKKSLWKWRNEKEKRKKKPSINSLRNITQNIIKSQILYGIKSSPFLASLYLKVCKESLLSLYIRLHNLGSHINDFWISMVCWPLDVFGRSLTFSWAQ